MNAKPGPVSGSAPLLARTASLAGLVVSALLVAAPAAAHAPPPRVLRVDIADPRLAAEIMKWMPTERSA